MSFWEELKRRHIFRVSATYAVVAWLLVQVAAVVLPAFELPSWILQTFLAFIALGFVVALVLAWIFDLTPQGLKRTDDMSEADRAVLPIGRKLDFIVIALLFVAVAFLGFSKYIGTPEDGISTPQVQSLAVLAFANRSSDPEDAYFADGLADELLSVLGRVRELRVASRTSSFNFKGRDLDVASIASTLQVKNVLSGSVRRDGDRIRVTAALDNAEGGDLLWTETYDRTFENILDIQSDIARSVALAIVPVLSPESRAQIETRPTESTVAYDYYLRGREYLRLPAEAPTLASAIELFDRAIGLDPQFAQAYAGRCESLLNTYSFAKTPDSFRSAETACHRALTLDDGSWQVRLALGMLYRFSGQYDKAVLEFEAGMSIQPNAVDLVLELATTYESQNLRELSEATYLQAAAMDGGYWLVHTRLGNLLSDMGRYEEAIERHRRVVQLNPDSGIGYDNLGNTYLSIGELDDAEAAFDASPAPSRWTYMNRGLVRYYKGDYAAAVADERRAIDLAPEVPEPWGFLADAYRFIPEKGQESLAAYAKAIELAEQALDLNPSDWRLAGWLGVYYAHAGQETKAAEQLVELLQHTEHPDVYYFSSQIALSLGQTERALDYMGATIKNGWTRELLRLDPDLASLSSNPRYVAVLAPMD